MEILFKQGLIEKSEGERQVSYLLKDDSLFSPIDFKLLLNQTEKEVLKCVKVIYNGKIKLIYLTQGYRRLDQVLPSIGAADFLNITKKLIAAIIRLRENSFLKSAHLDISRDRIFIDWKTQEVKLVYLPLEDGQSAIPEIEFDNLLRRRIIEWKTEAFISDGPGETEFFDMVSDDQYQLKDICRRYCGGQAIGDIEKRDGKKNLGNARLVLQSSDNAGYMRFEVDADEYLMGKSAISVQGTVTGSPRVSRKHCRITRYGQSFYVTDLESTNGTYIDGQRLQPGQPYALFDRAVLRLADVSFKVTIAGSNEK